MMEVICSSGTSVFTRATWHHVPEDGILWRYSNSQEWTSLPVLLVFILLKNEMYKTKMALKFERI
jgi:hypothetical protein